MRSIIALSALCLLAVIGACSGGDKESFRSVDHDGNGKISYEEMLFIFPDMTPELFHQLDPDSDGALSENEYGIFLQNDALRAAASQTRGTPPRAATTQSGEAKPLAVPYKGEEIIEIPAPTGDASARTKTEKTKKEQKDARGKTDPSKRGDATQYTVVRGDNLSRIAHKFGLTVEDITRANGDMNPDTLRDGQILNIPARP